MISLSITMITYSYTISKICNLVQKLTYILCFDHMRLMVSRGHSKSKQSSEDELSIKLISFPRVMLICWGNGKNNDHELFMNIL